MQYYNIKTQKQSNFSSFLKKSVAKHKAAAKSFHKTSKTLNDRNITEVFYAPITAAELNKLLACIASSKHSTPPLRWRDPTSCSPVSPDEAHGG
ncbi:hypothetical protein HMPREF1981_00036 [Bacteroides pyogenes F0041]|uniref:Uncharacterized protein n=1 Tax=Bacteroides pyogenes F0041 TaxID=1321819 RepID=U2E9K5_9BACE|nr:hypothetical protein HMPREF1981_00036 [Bacteroides pyogenes F0041]